MTAILIPDTNNIPKKVQSLYIGDSNNVPKKIKKIYIGDENNEPKKIHNSTLNVSIKIEVGMIHTGSNYSLAAFHNSVTYATLKLTAQITDANIPPNISIPILFYAKINGNSNSDYVAINTTDYLTSDTAKTKSFTKSYSSAAEISNGWHASNGAQIKEAYLQYNGVKYCQVTNIVCKAPSSDISTYSNTWTQDITVEL